MQPNSPDTILIVEDDEGVAVLERRALERRGYKVRSAVTVNDAMAIIQNQEIALLVADFRLPDGATGLDLCSQLHALGHDMPVILVTGFSDESTVIGALRQGVRDFVLKSTDYLQYLPIAVERVLQAVRTERQLAIAEARFQTFMDNMPAWAFIEDAAGRLLYANPSMQTFLGDDWRGKSTADRLRQSDLDVLEGKPSNQRMHQINLPDGSVRQLVYTKFAMRDENGEQLIGGMAFDVTEQRTAEEALRQKDEQLRHAQKMDAVGQLAGGVAHDFNNLLMVITGYTDMLLRNSQSNNTHDGDFLSEIAKAADRAALLTRQLLAFSRKQVLEPQTVDLNAVIAGTEAMLRRLIGEDIIFRTALAADLAKVWLDPGQVEQVIVNLVLNARDAMPMGGELDIKTENVEIAANGPSCFGDLKPGTYVMFSVTDTGFGMDEATRSRIFEPFFTTKAPGKGTGLGLAMVYGIVNQSEGYISVDSELQRGTTFSIYVPAKYSDCEASVTTRREARELRGFETVLLVEDEPSVRALTRTALESYGYKVLEAIDPLDAIQISDSHRGVIDLLLADVVMPHLGGRQLAELLEGERPNLRVLYVSGYTDDQVVRRGIQQSEVNFLQKPFTPVALAEKLRAVLDGENAANHFNQIIGK